ncbi:DEDD exonuclease domain-containing protein [Bogoriella caseilytica]|uniref:DNA polymerase-3 subunit epsilon n=1 Tax=Bogoriella caseilytica TaxID=56055 RepID=A0A3N2B948_9MICO|nr:DEDD exonuclease domain-containing protein [Bogoriella caseilytica]ROR71777.1 DNA polymerase-3 subunit epsilon [Bogoriella caseilytica]
MRAPSFLATAPGGRLHLDALDRASDLEAQRRARPVQLGLDEVGIALRDVTFVVVDLETTGAAPATAEITEIGAVKVRGGEVLGEFQTLVDPGSVIPPQITVLTGITQAMVATAPAIDEVLPAFLAFAGLEVGAPDLSGNEGAGAPAHTVLVAHNAGFDVGFLKAAAAKTGRHWPRVQILDTVALGRRFVTRDEVPNHKLATLAAFFRADVDPTHRALDDARATVDVLHGLLARGASAGVTHLEDLRTATDPVPARRRRKATMADTLPTSPGVYLFEGPGAEVLYVGTATNVRRRVRSYFTASEKRKRIGEMLDIATAVRPVPCATVLEAQVRELRLIAELDPPYNRRSRRPQTRPWLRLTDEAYPRLSIARALPAGAMGHALGPFTSRRAATAAMEALQQVSQVRRCTARLPLTAAPEAVACALAEMGHCGAPCTGAQGHVEYAGVLTGLTEVLTGRVDAAVGALRERIARLAAQQRYEEAAVDRDRLAALLRAARLSERLRPLVTTPQIIAARPRTANPQSAQAGGWELAIIRYGRLAGTAVAPRGHDPVPVIESLRLTAEHVPAPELACGAAPVQESELVIDWLWQEGTRLVEVSPGPHPLAYPTDGAGRHAIPGS